MNGMFYILAKKKYILYLLIPKKKRSSHTSKKKISPSYITKKIDIVPLTNNVVLEICVCGNATVPFIDASTYEMVPKTKSGSNGGIGCDCALNNDCDHVNSKDNTNSIQAIVVATILNINCECSTSVNPTVDTVDTVVDSTDLASSTNFKSRVESVPGPKSVSNLVCGLLSCNKTDDGPSPNILLTLSSKKFPGINNNTTPTISSSLSLTSSPNRFILVAN